VSEFVPGYIPSEWGKLFHASRVNELLGAGSAGPGKSMVLLFDPMEQVISEHARISDKHHPYKMREGMSTGWALHLRREFPMLQETIERSHKFFPLVDPDAKFDKRTNTWEFRSGYHYQFGHCQHEEDWGNYLSKQFTHIGYDELTQFNEEQYHQINARLRSADPVLRHMLKIRACSNPFCKREKGQNYSLHDPHWVRKRFVEPNPNGRVIIAKEFRRKDGGKFERTRMYLPATLYDNPDPDFVANYEEQLLDKPPHIRQAMLYGDWYVTIGGHYAEDWQRPVHVCEPFKIPGDWPIFRSMDWGFKHHGVIGWWAEDHDGTLYGIREFKFRLMHADRCAQRVQEIERGMGLWAGNRSRITGPADTQLWEQRGDTSLSKAQMFSRAGVPWLAANKKSRANNSQLFLRRLKNQVEGRPNGIVFFNTMRYCISTLPTIQSDPADPEAPCEGGDDHGHDMVMYTCSYASRGVRGKSRDLVDREVDDERDERSRRHQTPQGRGRYGYGS
jgi:hypothetical protein